MKGEQTDMGCRMSVEGEGMFKAGDWRAASARAVDAVLSPLIPDGAPIVLFDFPHHGNVGDSAIWVGETDYLKTSRPRSEILWMAAEGVPFDHLKYALPDNAIILIHGGGNLGDLWPRHQRLRELVLASFDRHRVIQLPQSIHFTEEDNLDRFRKVASAHPDFHVLVRDSESLNTAMTFGAASAALCPDMALCMRSLPRRASPVYPLLGLLRTDKEVEKRFRLDTSALDDLHVEDWVVEPDSLLLKVERWLTTRYPGKSSFLRPVLYDRIATMRLARGCELLSKGRVVITDRLHGHILCSMLGIRHVTLDNFYRKIGNFRDAWNTGDGLCFSASSLKEAHELARSISNDG